MWEVGMSGLKNCRASWPQISWRMVASLAAHKTEYTIKDKNIINSKY